VRSSDALGIWDQGAQENICRRHGEEAAGETSVMGNCMIRALHESGDVKEGGMRRT
jgi:hypothetical protein